MAIDDLVNKGKEFFEQNKDKVQAAVSSDQAEDITDKIIHGTADAVKKVVPAEHHGAIDDVAAKIDGSVGNDGAK